MNTEEAKQDAAKHYNMSEHLQGERDADNHVNHVSGTDSYNAGYSFGIFKQEQVSGVYG